MEEGYYWVKPWGGRVQIARMFHDRDWDGKQIDVWEFIGSRAEYGPEDLEHIGPRIKP